MSSIVNRRNAILGWTVWTVSKTAAKRRAEQALKPEGGNGLPTKRVAVVSGLAAATGGALLYWRLRGGDDEE
jgi:hypothetical protein